MRIAVAGGSGVVGRLVEQEALRRGHQVRTLARAAGVDVFSGRGLVDALQDVHCVIDTLSVATQSDRTSTRFFSETTRRLLAAETQAGTTHHIALSIVGVDRAPFGYYAGKVAQEKLVSEGSVPWTIQRATQFHEFAAQTIARASLGPVRLAVNMRTQPIAAHEVAVRLVDQAEAAPQGRAHDLAGPHEESLARMMRAYAERCGYRGRMPAVSLPGAFGKATRDGRLLQDPSIATDLGTLRFDAWLDAQPRVRAKK